MQSNLIDKRNLIGLLVGDRCTLTWSDILDCSGDMDWHSVDGENHYIAEGRFQGLSVILRAFGLHELEDELYTFWKVEQGTEGKLYEEYEQLRDDDEVDTPTDIDQLPSYEEYKKQLTDIVTKILDKYL